MPHIHRRLNRRLMWVEAAARGRDSLSTKQLNPHKIRKHRGLYVGHTHQAHASSSRISARTMRRRTDSTFTIFQKLTRLRRMATQLQTEIEHYFAAGATAVGDAAAMDAFLRLRDGLEAGMLRSAEPDPAATTGWRVNAWVKQGILLGFRLGKLAQLGGHDLAFSARCAGRVRCAAGQLPCRRRGLHAAQLCERGRLCGRGHHG